MFKHVDLDAPLLIKVSDLGGAFFLSEPPAKPVTPLGLRSPELILGEPIGKAHGIWSFGCLMFEILTGTWLFGVMPPMPSDWGSESFSETLDAISNGPEDENEHGEPAEVDHQEFDRATVIDVVRRDQETEESGKDMYDRDPEHVAGTDDSTDDDHVLQMACILGPLPSSFRAKYPRSNVYFDDRGTITKPYVGEPPEDYDFSELTPPSSLEIHSDNYKGEDIGSQDATTVKELLRHILQLDPAERPTAEALLAHPWFMHSSST